MTNFWSKVEVIHDPSSCWLWKGGRTKAGYGTFHLRTFPYSTTTAHRYAYISLFGKTEVVRHKCNNPACVRPSHLLGGTQKQNIADKKSWAIKLTPEKVLEIRSLFGKGYSYQKIAEITNSKKGTVYDIFTGKIWKWLK